jgi:hypothetical protein
MIRIERRLREISPFGRDELPEQTR